MIKVAAFLAFPVFVDRFPFFPVILLFTRSLRFSLESHIGWFHNQIKELHDWYFIQTVAANPRARKVTYSTEEMGHLIATPSVMRWATP